MKINRLWAAARNFLNVSLNPGMTVFCVLLCASSISLSVAAQDPPAAQSSQSQDQQPVARPIPQRTVGLEPGKVVKWGLRDAILMALENNPDIELERSNARLAQYDLFAA